AGNPVSFRVFSSEAFGTASPAGSSRAAGVHEQAPQAADVLRVRPADRDTARRSWTSDARPPSSSPIGAPLVPVVGEPGVTAELESTRTSDGEEPTDAYANLECPQPERIDFVDRVLEHVSIEIDVVSGEFDRILACKALQERRVVARPVGIQARPIVFAPGELEGVRRRRAAGGHLAE